MDYGQERERIRLLLRVIKTKGKSQQSYAVGSLVGELLPLQPIYGGKTKRCHPAYKFPGDWLVSHSHDHWANENTMLEYRQEVIVPFVESKREALGLNYDQPALAIFDHFKGGPNN